MSEIPIPLDDPALPAGWGPWDLPANCCLETDGGPDNRAALKLSRTDPAEYLNAHLTFPLPEDARYLLSADIRIEKPTEVATKAAAGIEFFDAEKRFLGGGYLPAVDSPEVLQKRQTHQQTI